MISFTRHGLSLLEVMISILILAVVAAATNQIILASANLQSTSTAKDVLSSDIASVWNHINRDLTRSTWYIPETSGSFSTNALSTDRTLFYCPLVLQTGAEATTASPGFSTHTGLSAFNRGGTSDLRLDTLRVDGITPETLDQVLPGTAADRALPPSGIFTDGSYQTSYFARSQDLIFVRAATSAWDVQRDAPRPNPSGTPRDIQAPVEMFPGTTTQWSTPGQHDALQVLFPSPFTSATGGAGAISWNLRPGVTQPYGRVMESAWLDEEFNLQPQLELSRAPTYSSYTKEEVRLFAYQVVPSPIGMGRLVRTYLVRNPSTIPVLGSEPGQCIAQEGTNYVVVDSILSEHVVRILFETARHSDTLGINGIRATIFFARVSERQRSNALIIRRSVTMIFGMRAQNTPGDQETFRGIIKTSTTPGSGAIPFSY
jgi:prepilin-type N-terminal cleavage/methylation domain-containing protein